MKGAHLRGLLRRIATVDNRVAVSSLREVCHELRKQGDEAEGAVRSDEDLELVEGDEALELADDAESIADELEDLFDRLHDWVSAMRDEIK